MFGGDSGEIIQMGFLYLKKNNKLLNDVHISCDSEVTTYDKCC